MGGIIGFTRKQFDALDDLLGSMLERIGAFETQVAGEIPEYVNDWLDEHPEATTTVEDGVVSLPKLASDTIEVIESKLGNGSYSTSLTAGAADGITGGGPTDTAEWTYRACPGTDGPATIESIHGNTIVQDGELLSVQMDGIESADAGGNVLTNRTIPAATYFPDGMRSAGSVYDELTATECITRVGAVDLGTLTWTYVTSGESPYFSSNRLTDAVYSSSRDNYKCARYDNVSVGGTGNATGINIIDSLNVRVRDTSYTDAAAFKAAMSGVMLHYALATPTTTPIDPPLNLTYRVSDFGTERIMHTDLTAAPTLVVTYGSTADGIRDRALACIAPMENGLASANYGVGSYLIHGGTLCRVTTAIAAGEAITIGTNVVATTVMAELLTLTQ